MKQVGSLMILAGIILLCEFLTIHIFFITEDKGTEYWVAIAAIVVGIYIRAKSSD